MALRTLALTSVIGCALSASVIAGCSGASGLDSDNSASHVTTIPQSDVIDQGEAGNCWLYTTGAWIESLHAEATSDSSIHFSPAYWLYWELYDQVTTGDLAQGTVQFGGYFPRAMDIVARYGMMKLGTFAQDDAQASLDAVKAMNAALATGDLATPDARKDAARVRKALDAAFNLSAALTTTLTNTFSEDGSRTFQNGAQPADPSVTNPHDFKVWSVRQNGPVLVTLDQLLGARGAAVDPTVPRYFTRVGELAWNSAYPPAAATATTLPGQYRRLPHLRRALGADADGGVVDDGGVDAGSADDAASASDGGPATPDTTAADALKAANTAFMRRIQVALNAGAPLPIGWFVNFAAMDATGRFRASAAPVAASLTGGHETLLTDYEVTDVPGYGTLSAGFSASEDQKKKALEGNLVFFRVKNSWGKTPQNLLEPLAGYNDLDVAYLTGTTTVCPDANGQATQSACVTYSPQIMDVAFPPGF